MSEKAAIIRKMLKSQNLKGWLLYDFHDLNPIAKRMAPLPDGVMLTRRWAYWIPAEGQPAWLVHAIERGQFSENDLRLVTYSSWKSFELALFELTNGPGPIAVEYSPDCGIPYTSWIDAGTADQLRRLGYQMHSSADLIQAVYAAWTPHQLETHREAVRLCLDAMIIQRRMCS